MHRYLVGCQIVKWSVGGNFDSPQTATIWFMVLLGNAIIERGSRKLGVFTGANLMPYVSSIWADILMHLVFEKVPSNSGYSMISEC